MIGGNKEHPYFNQKPEIPDMEKLREETIKRIEDKNKKKEEFRVEDDEGDIEEEE